MTAKPDLVERLRAELDRLEEIAQAATSWRVVFGTTKAGVRQRLTDFANANDPAHVLRTIEAHRKIIEAVERWEDPHPGVPCTNAGDPWEPCELHASAERRLPPYARDLLAFIYFPEGLDYSV